MAKPYNKNSSKGRARSSSASPAPKQTRIAPERPSASGISRAASRALGGLGLMSYSSDVGADSDIPKNYPGEGLKAKEKSPPTKSDAPRMERYRESAASAKEPSAETKPVRASIKASEYPPEKSSIDTTELKRYRDTNLSDSSKAPASRKAASSPAKPKPKSKPRSRPSTDSYDPNLDSSVAVGTTARASMGPSGMRYENAPRGQTFKKGGKVASRGDGIAQRGRTKGRFI